MKSTATAALMIALVAGCSRSALEAPHDFMAVNVPCTIHAGESVADGEPPQTEAVIGPQACARSLELYFRANPAAHIGNIVPILAPPASHPPSAIVQAGTQSLFVQQAVDGPWPQAARLAIRVLSCPLASGSDDVDCARGLENAKQAGIVAWVPINSEGAKAAAPYTREILYVYEHR
jgi:hypothetical protein